MTPADELRAAAAKVRTQIDELEGFTAQGEWEPHQLLPGSDYYVIMAHSQAGDAQQVTSDATKPTADFIATMQPSVGSALADWLDSEADHGADIDVAALTLARRINHPAP